MGDRSVHDDFEIFRQRRADLADPFVDLEVRLATLREGGVLGVGLLIGGGFPGAAACLTVLLEHRFPEGPGWPWTGEAEA